MPAWLLARLGVVGDFLWKLIRRPKPADDPLGRVRAATEAAKKVDPSQEAIRADEDNLDGPNARPR